MSAAHVIRLDATQSTNADAMRFAREGSRGPLWVVAREQRAGRGRRDRPWTSPPGNLYASLLLTAPCAPDVAPQLGFVAGVALVDAIDGLLGRDRRVRLKWPNDLLADGAKVAGILVEASHLDGDLVCVVGIGVNCLSHPVDLPYAATDLSALAGREISPDDLLPLLQRAMTDRLARWDRGLNFGAIREQWLARAAGRGRSVTVTLHDRVLHGTFDTIDATGRLLIATETGPLVIDAGDVRFAPDAFAQDTEAFA